MSVNGVSCRLIAVKGHSSECIQCINNQWIKPILENLYKGTEEPPCIIPLVEKDVTATPYAEDNKVAIPYLFLLKKEDIPKKFHIENANDDKLEDDLYLEDLLRWTEEKFHINTPQKLGLQAKEALRMFIKFICIDPKKAENAKKFVIGHEIAHILHKHGDHNFNATKDFKKLLIVIAVFLVALGAAIFFPYAWIGFIAVTVVTTGFGVRFFKSMKESHKCEKEADLTAAKLGREVTEGGRYLFKTMRDHIESARKKSLILKVVYTFADKDTHPSNNKRAKYLKQFS